jgi:hypothetical protein
MPDLVGYFEFLRVCGDDEGFCLIPKYKFLAISVKVYSTLWPVLALFYHRNGT